ncbi:hypothetical protein EHS25_006912 [Saitozyma podzolica]|uniref:Uncharacterized protein n=1 Tax=Saitozyma podzolica TaxID=1890683 RepID=A0A427XRB6_9TREE|nr:hypothetical protein EHS25_006912 [Saitozyma podzolica]
MVRVLALLASLALVMAAAIPRQQLPLIVHDAGCNGYDASAVDPKAQTFGFVNLVRNGADELIAEVVLRGAKPFSTYGVRLIQVDGDVALNCQYGDFNNRFTFFLTTDGSGNGAANVQEVASSQATTALFEGHHCPLSADAFQA